MDIEFLEDAISVSTSFLYLKQYSMIISEFKMNIVPYTLFYATCIKLYKIIFRHYPHIFDTVFTSLM